MTIIVLRPNKARCRPFWMLWQLETGGWGHGKDRRQARRRMLRHKRFKAELEAQNE